MSGSSSKLPEPAHVDRDDGALLGPLREGDERVFTALVDRWGGMMLRLALSHVENRAIAEELFISEKTVARHVSNIFDKLGVSSRSAATAWAYQRNLI